MAKEIKREFRTEVKPKMHFAFEKQNYKLLIIGIALLIIGFFLLSGGGSSDPDVFNTDLFSPRRMVIAPLILLGAYILVGVAILKTPKNNVN
jgi:hypothetical protein